MTETLLNQEQYAHPTMKEATGEKQGAIEIPLTQLPLEFLQQRRDQARQEMTNVNAFDDWLRFIEAKRTWEDICVEIYFRKEPTQAAQTQARETYTNARNVWHEDQTQRVTEYLGWEKKMQEKYHGDDWLSQAHAAKESSPIKEYPAEQINAYIAMTEAEVNAGCRPPSELRFMKELQETGSFRKQGWKQYFEFVEKLKEMGQDTTVIEKNQQLLDEMQYGPISTDDGIMLKELGERIHKEVQDAGGMRSYEVKQSTDYIDWMKTRGYQPEMIARAEQSVKTDMKSESEPLAKEQ